MGRVGGATGKGFVKGDKRAGRRKGSKPKIPAALMDALIKAIHARNPNLIEKSLERGLKADPPANFQFLQLVAHYHDGKPTEKIALSGQIGIAGEVKFYLPTNLRDDETE